MSVVIGVVGLSGCGKSVVAGYLTEHYAMERVYFGGYVVDEVLRRGLGVNAKNERVVREEMRVLYGNESIALRAMPDIVHALDAHRSVVIDGIYSLSEYLYLQDNLPDILRLVAIHVPRVLRYTRLSNRAVRPLRKEEVDERDLAEIRNLEKGGPIALADYHIINDKTKEDLFAGMDVVMRGLRENGEQS